MGARALGRGGRRRTLRERLSALRPSVSMPRLPDLRRLARRMLLLVILLVAIAAAYVFWFRDSSLVAVERVTVTGAEGEPATAAALTEAAEGMSTLHVDQAALEAAVADMPAVLSVSAEADFPHGLTITVDSRTPAAFLAEGETIVAGDGVVLETGAERPEELPLIEGEGAAVEEPGDRIEGGSLTLARILGAAPEPLVPYAGTARMDPDNGPVIEIGEGIELRFGDPSQAELKWAAAAAVLADPGLDSAVYIDLAVPARPVVG